MAAEATQAQLLSLVAEEALLHALAQAVASERSWERSAPHSLAPFPLPMPWRSQRLSAEPESTLLLEFRRRTWQQLWALVEGNFPPRQPGLARVPVAARSPAE